MSHRGQANRRFTPRRRAQTCQDDRRAPTDAELTDAGLRVSGRLVALRELTRAEAELLDRWDDDRAATMGEFNDFGPRPGRSLVDRLDAGERLVSRDAGKLVVEQLEDSSVVGDVGWHVVCYGPNEESRALNIGISLLPEARGKGYGAEAQRLLAELLLATYDVARVEASTDVDNHAEQRALVKAGFVREGVLRQAQYRAGAFHDLVVYSLVRGDLG